MIVVYRALNKVSREIFQLRTEGWLLRELSDRFGIFIARVSKILSDKSGRYE